MWMLICPNCGASNPSDALKCGVCDASLEGVHLVSSEDEPQFLNEDEHLTDLLHALKQDEDVHQSTDQDEGERFISSEREVSVETPPQIDDEPEVPEWLNRIRQRAQIEPDAVGEATQKIIAARESLETARAEPQPIPLESLLHKAHDGRDESLSLPGSDVEGEETLDPPATVRDDWLKRIRKKHRPAEAEDAEEILSEREGDSLLHWLVALENGDQAVAGGKDVKPGEGALQPEDTQEVDLSIDLLQATRELILNEIKGTQLEAMVLSINREEQARANQLALMLHEERAPHHSRALRKTTANRGLRLIIGVLLITILSLVLFMGHPKENLSDAIAQPAQDVLTWVHGLSPEASVLLVMDYSAAFSGEMGLVATPILREIFSTRAEITTLSSVPSGRLLFDRLLEEGNLVDQRVVADLGYFPVGAFGAYGLAAQPLQAENALEFSISLPVEPFDGIVILGDDYEGVMAWVEQLSSLKPDAPMILLLSAQAGPLLKPYWESGQVTGMISGIVDVANLDGQTVGLSTRWFAYRVGTVLMILMLLIGMSLSGSRATEADDRRGGEHV